jgi:hypothetical protein
VTSPEAAVFPTAGSEVTSPEAATAFEEVEEVVGIAAADRQTGR